MRLLRWLLVRTDKVVHPKGYIIHSESNRFGRGALTNLCVWDGTRWHQAPLDLWDRRDPINYLEVWIKAHLPQDAWESESAR